MTTENAQRLVIRRASWEADGVMSLELVSADGGDLPGWEPGAHLDIVVPSGLVRQYSLCGDTADRSRYRIAVLREPESRGGSAEIHDTALIGRTIEVRGPRNHFPLEPAVAYVFVAGGIGITPLLPMVAAAERAGVAYQVVYGGRSLASMAFRDELPVGAHVRLIAEDTGGRPDLATVVKESPEGAVVYACGPNGMLDALAEACERVGRELRLERFGSDGEGAAEAATGASFEVELRRTGAVVRVGESDRMLDRILETCPDLMTSCEEGFCGTCETTVLEGIPEHHDTILNEKERATGKTMMVCVGRSKSSRLVLDL
ncbi:PDR/VanB family oxidoreductase [Nocardioides sp. NPDC047086]|uniref:PDR/VanB family oxidoreductase n=1 Tax=Nocardioides sp. NPDC047086 TaxID=3154810 RepID=UPI0033F2F658